MAAFLVLDGHGRRGHFVAETGAAVLEQKLQEVPPDAHFTLFDLANSIKETDSDIQRQNIVTAFEGGSTIACAVFTRETIPGSTEQKFKLKVGNAGDTRIVLCKNGKAIRLSSDHNANNSLEVKRIESIRGGIVADNGRVCGTHHVTRGFGDFGLKEYIIADPYTTEVVIDKFDEYLIIGTDGLWDGLTDEEAVALITGELSWVSLQGKAVGLAATARKKTKDDITCVLVDLRDFQTVVEV